MGPYPYRYEKVKIAADSDPDGHHIIVLVLLIFLKFYPEIIEEGRLSVLLPPLYGAKKDKEFIPIYNVKEFDELQKTKRGFTFQRFKGLGELIADNMRKVLDNDTEYVIRSPKNKKIIDKLLKIVTDTEEKRKYLERLEFNFESFIEEVFEGKEGV